MAGKPWGDFLSPSPCQDWNDDRAATRLFPQGRKNNGTCTETKLKGTLRNICNNCLPRCGARVKQGESDLIRQEEELEHRRTRNSANLP